jgi:nanoRNase/pAp phosphatase (c-di-AMP/oligoRNAs hydrolase)
MPAIDVCNGDADGLFALRQLRLAEPSAATLVTGLKRDIALLERVDARAGDAVTVLDISLARNRAALLRLLDAGASVRWFDHHDAGDVPAHPRLQVHIDTDPAVCTSLLVDRFLGGRFGAWAVAAAYGDNLAASAERLADALALAPERRAALRRLGEAVNYNAYGETEADVRIHPAALYRWLAQYDDACAAAAAPLVLELDALRRSDLQRARALAPVQRDDRCAAYVLPDAAWSRRVLGTFANELAAADPQRAHAVLLARPDGAYAVSVRAPLATPRGADALAREFGGGGRQAAAGIDRLERADLARFLARFADAWRAAS